MSSGTNESKGFSKKILLFIAIPFILAIFAMANLYDGEKNVTPTNGPPPSTPSYLTPSPVNPSSSPFPTFSPEDSVDEVRTELTDADVDIIDAMLVTGVENFYAISPTETIADREVRLTPFFVTGSPLFLVAPIGSALTTEKAEGVYIDGVIQSGIVETVNPISGTPSEYKALILVTVDLMLVDDNGQPVTSSDIHSKAEIIVVTVTPAADGNWYISDIKKG